MEKLVALSITFFAGLLFLLGVLIIKKVSNKNSVYKFCSSLAFSVIICLIIFDIVPEIIESFSHMGQNKSFIYAVSFILIGIIILKLLDNLIPMHNHEHHDNEKNEKEHNDHLYHIGTITTFAVILHNIIEGMAIYTLSLSSFQAGLIMCIGVGLHNIPMGMEIFLTLNLAKKSLKYKYITGIFIVLSTVIGGAMALLFKIVNPTILGILISITCGMLIYISIFELLNEVKRTLKYKHTILGLITGVVLMLLTFLI